MGCGESAPKERLVRFVLRGDSLEPDPSATLPGRGAYLHRDAGCGKRAIARRAFDRSFRTRVQAPDPSLLESLR